MSTVRLTLLAVGHALIDVDVDDLEGCRSGDSYDPDALAGLVGGADFTNGVAVVNPGISVTLIEKESGDFVRINGKFAEVAAMIKADLEEQAAP